MKPAKTTAFSGCIIWFVMIWMAGLPLTHFLALGVMGLGGIVAVYPFLAEYQKLRLLSFVTPNAESDIVREQVFNVEQALISVGSGGWWVVLIGASVAAARTPADPGPQDFPQGADRYRRAQERDPWRPSHPPAWAVA